MFQLLVGEIGISRHEFYHDLRWWEVKAIIRGYNNRHHHGWEQARLVAYHARFCMGSKDPIPVISDWLKFSWEAQKAEPVPKEIQDQLQAEMAAMNEQLAKQKDNG